MEENLTPEEERSLPIGTVVVLKGAKAPIMVIGRKLQAEQTGVIYEYGAVPYPCGYLNAHGIVMFDRAAVEEVLFMGFATREFEIFEKAISKAEV